MTRTKVVGKLGATCVALAMLGGCVAPSDGLHPPSDQLYFPVGLAVSPGGNALYVASSDFDLQYNAGTVEMLDLAKLRGSTLDMPGGGTFSLLGLLKAINLTGGTSSLGDVCKDSGSINSDPVSYPGPCGAIPLAPYSKGSVEIGAFATDIAFVCQPPLLGSLDSTGIPATTVSRGGSDCADGVLPEGSAGSPDARAKLFLPVRGDPSLTYFEVTDDRPNPRTPDQPGTQDFLLECGQAANDGRCDDAHRLGITAFDNTRSETMRVEPFELAVSEGAESILVTHQIDGVVTLFTPPAGLPGAAAISSNVVATPPVLQYVLGNLPTVVTAVAPIPIPELVLESGKDQNGSYLANYQPGFLIGFRSAQQIDLIRFYDDGAARPARPFVQATGALGIGAAASVDSRSLAFDSSPSSARRVCERACPVCAGTTGLCSARYDCLAACLDVPVAFYVGSRAYDVNGNPTLSNLLVGQSRGSLSAQGGGDFVSVVDAVPLAYGVSRVVVGRIRGLDMQWHTRVFASLFEARAIYIYDPEAGQIEAVVGTGRGPYAIAIDPVEPLAYVAHFTDSYIGVIDLNAANTTSFETMFATLGSPVTPRESQ